MPDTIYVDFLYVDENSVDVLERIAEEFNHPEWDHVEARGPRERFGVTELRLSHKSGGPTLIVSLEANELAADDRSHTIPDVPAIEMHIGVDELEIDENETRVEKLLDLVEGIYGATQLPPTYVYGLDPFHVQGVGDLLEPPTTEAGLHQKQINDVSWLMLFPPAFVEEIGRQKILTAPSYKIHEFDDGAILLVAVPDPTDPNGVDYSELRAHFGFDDPGPNI